MKGRKRTIVTDVLGLVLKCHVSSANCADVKLAPWVLFSVIEDNERMAKILADPGYEGDVETDLAAVYSVPLAVVRKEGKGFQVQPKQWVVERTWAWLENCRGLTRDYERLPEHHEGMVYLAMIRLMLRRLTHNQKDWKNQKA